MRLVGGRGGALAGIRSMHTCEDGIPQPPVSSCQRTPCPRRSPCPRRPMPWHDGTGRGRSRRQVHRCAPRSHSRSGRNRPWMIGSSVTGTCRVSRDRRRNRPTIPSATTSGTVSRAQTTFTRSRCIGLRPCPRLHSREFVSSWSRIVLARNLRELGCGDPEGLALPYRQGGLPRSALGGQATCEVHKRSLEKLRAIPPGGLADLTERPDPPRPG